METFTQDEVNAHGELRPQDQDRLPALSVETETWSEPSAGSGTTAAMVGGRGSDSRQVLVEGVQLVPLLRQRRVQVQVRPAGRHLQGTVLQLQNNRIC